MLFSVKSFRCLEKSLVKNNLKKSCTSIIIGKNYVQLDCSFKGLVIRKTTVDL